MEPAGNVEPSTKINIAMPFITTKFKLFNALVSEKSSRNEMGFRITTFSSANFFANSIHEQQFILSLGKRLFHR